MRTMPENLRSSVTNPVVNILILVQIDFDSGTVGLNSGFKTIEYLGVTFQPAGHLANISQIEETPGVKSSNVSITLSSIKAEVFTMIKNQPFLNKKCKIYLALTDEAYFFDAEKCTLIFSGSLDGANGVLGNGASITLAVKSRLADWERPRRVRYTDAEQQKLYPGDKGLEFIPQLSQRKLIWPRAAFLPDPRD